MRSITISDDLRNRLYGQLSQFLPEVLADELIRHHTAVTYAKGAVIFLQGSPADLMFWVLSGMVKVYSPRPDGNISFVKLCGPGDMLGYVNYVDQDGRRLQSFEAEAVTKCTVAIFTREHAARMLEKLERPVLLQLMEHLNTAWSSVAYRFSSFLGLTYRQRLELTFQDLAARFGVEDKRGILLPMKLSHAQLAEMIDGSRPMVTRLIAQLIAEGALFCQGKQYIIPNRPNGAAKAESAARTNGHNVRPSAFVNAAISRERVASVGGYRGIRDEAHRISS